MEGKRSTYDVGGVVLERPFKLRRLGHFGVDLHDLDDGIRFYVDDLGFRITDLLDLKASSNSRHQALAANSPDGRLIFTSYGTDHHAFLLNHRALSAAMGVTAGEVTVNQLTWQVGTLEEVVEAYDFLRVEGVEVVRIGRDMPGGNWHVYFRDPDGHQNELYYGMEQVGWSRHSRPRVMYDRAFSTRPDLPQISEHAEVDEAIARGVDLLSGYRPAEPQETSHDVGGILLPRPFKITRIGPVAIFVRDLDASVDFYQRILGFQLTEEVDVNGRRCAFLRIGVEHHSLMLAPIELRSELGFSAHSTLLSFGLELGSYRQLKDAVDFLRARGWQFLAEVPSQLHTGVDYAAYVLDPEGHCMMLYYYMEQVGWDGRPRPAEQRRIAESPWPESLQALSDTYADQTFQGPLG